MSSRVVCGGVHCHDSFGGNLSPWTQNLSNMDPWVFSSTFWISSNKRSHSQKLKSKHHHYRKDKKEVRAMKGCWWETGEVSPVLGTLWTTRRPWMMTSWSRSVFTFSNIPSIALLGGRRWWISGSLSYFCSKTTHRDGTREGGVGTARSQYAVRQELLSIVDSCGFMWLWCFKNWLHIF